MFLYLNDFFLLWKLLFAIISHVGMDFNFSYEQITLIHRELSSYQQKQTAVWVNPRCSLNLHCGSGWWQTTSVRPQAKSGCTFVKAVCRLRSAIVSVFVPIWEWNSDGDKERLGRWLGTPHPFWLWSGKADGGCWVLLPQHLWPQWGQSQGRPARLT